MTKLSVIIPVYNVERYLQVCLESVALQGIEDMEVIVIDDGSTDSSGKICDEYAERHTTFKVIHQDNQGLSAARNLGIEVSQGEYIMFVDSDDYLVPESLAPLLETAIEHRLDFLGFGHVSVAENTNSVAARKYDIPQDIQAFNGVDFIEKHYCTSMVWWYICRSSIIKENNIYFPVGQMLEDADYNMRLMFCSQRIAMLPNIVYCHRKRTSSIMSNTNLEHQIKLLGDYLNAAVNVDRAITTYRPQMSAPYMERCLSHRDSYVFFGAIKALKLGKTKEFFSRAKEQGLYPFKRLSNTDYPGMKFTILHWLMQCQWAWDCLSKVYRVVK